MSKAFDMPVEEFYRLRDEEGLQHHEIAKEVFTSTSTLSLWKKRVGIVERIRTVKNYYRLRDEGNHDFHVAQQWNMSQQGLYQWKLVNDIDRRYFSAPPKQYSYTVEDYTKLRNLGYIDKEIYKMWGMPKSRLHHWKVVNEVPEEYFRSRNSKA